MRTPSDRIDVSATAGTLIAGRYCLDRELGRGGMGTVFVARDERLQRLVAVKLMQAEAPGANAFLRFEQEARAAASVHHPNVLVVHDAGWHEGAPFIVTELLDGSSLRERLRVGPMTSQEASSIALQFARGLAAAHRRGVIHRDLKPDNVFLTSDGGVKILDFGIARLVPREDSPGTLERGSAGPIAPSTATGAILGTNGYMSPEQIRGQPAGVSSDVFGFGAVLYEMLQGKPAFPGATGVERAYATLRSEPGALSTQVPDQLRAIVLKCLRKSAGERFQSMADLSFALEAAGAGPHVRSPAFRPGRATFAALSALVIVAAGAIAWRSRPWLAYAGPAASVEQLVALAATETSSAEALGAFRDGEVALRGGERAKAAIAFRRAAALDENLAAAHYRVAVASSVEEPGLAEDSIRRAVARAGDNVRMRSLALGFLELLEGRSADAITTYRSLLETEPDCVEAWTQLGDAIFHSAPFHGEGPAQAIEPFSRALVLDPGEPVALEHLLDLAEMTRHRPLALALADRLLSGLTDTSELRQEVRWTRSWALGDVDERNKLLQELARAPASAVKGVFLRSVWEEEDLSGAEQLAELLARRVVSLEQAQGDDLLAQVAWARGQPLHAIELLTKGQKLDPSPGRAFLRAWLTSEAARALPREEMEEAAALLRKADASSNPLLRPLSLSMLGRLALQRGLFDEAEEDARLLAAAAPIEGSSLGTDLALALRARIAAARGDRSAALDLLGQMRFVYPYRYLTVLSRLPEQTLRAELLEQSGQLERARAWLENGAAHDGPYEMLFLGPTLIAKARLGERLGDPSARNALAVAAKLWQSAEPSVMKELIAARDLDRPPR